MIILYCFTALTEKQQKKQIYREYISYLNLEPNRTEPFSSSVGVNLVINHIMMAILFIIISSYNRVSSLLLLI